MRRARQPSRRGFCASRLCSLSRTSSGYAIERWHVLLQMRGHFAQTGRWFRRFESREFRPPAFLRATGAQPAAHAACLWRQQGPRIESHCLRLGWELQQRIPNLKIVHQTGLASSKMLPILTEAKLNVDAPERQRSGWRRKALACLSMTALTSTLSLLP